LEQAWSESHVDMNTMGLLCPGRRCWHSATAAFQQLSSSCSTTLPAQYLRLSGLFSCQPHSPELSPGSGTQPSVQTASDVCLRRICLLDT